MASAEGLTGIILCAGYRREHSPPFGHHDARNVLDDRCGQDRRQLVMRRSRLSARRWLRSPPICRFSDPDRILCDPFSSPFSFFSAPCRSAAPSTWVSQLFNALFWKFFTPQRSFIRRDGDGCEAILFRSESKKFSIKIPRSLNFIILYQSVAINIWYFENRFNYSWYFIIKTLRLIFQKFGRFINSLINQLVTR